jgi:excisionase family DNA binding protein
MSDISTATHLSWLTQTIQDAICNAVPREAYSVDETAKLFGVSRRTIEGLIDSQQLRSVRVGRYLRIDRKEIDRYLGRNK